MTQNLNPADGTPREPYWKRALREQVGNATDSAKGAFADTFPRHVNDDGGGDASLSPLNKKLTWLVIKAAVIVVLLSSLGGAIGSGEVPVGDVIGLALLIGGGYFIKRRFFR